MRQLCNSFPPSMLLLWSIGMHMVVDHVGIEAWKITPFACQNYVPRTVEMRTWLSCLHCPQLSAMICYNETGYRNGKAVIAFEHVWGWANRQIHRGECTSNVPTDHSFEFKCQPIRHSVMKFMQSLGYVTRHHHSNANADEPWPLLKTFRTKCLHPGSPRKAILLVHRPHCQSQEPLDSESDETYAQSAMQTYKTESEGIRYYSYVLVYFYGTETPHDGGCTDLRFSILNFFLCKALWHDASHSMTGSTVFGYSEEICCTCPYADKKHRFSSKACSSTNASTMQNNRMHAKLLLLGFSSFRPSKFAWLHIGYAPCSHASKMKTFPFLFVWCSLNLQATMALAKCAGLTSPLCKQGRWANTEPNQAQWRLINICEFWEKICIYN